MKNPIIMKDPLSLRYYQVMKSYNKFFFKGKIVQGAETGRMYLTFILFNAPGLLSYYYVFQFFWQNYNYAIFIPAIILQVFCNYFFIQVAFTDPGIIPKNNIFHYTKEHNWTDLPFFYRKYKKIHHTVIINSHFLGIKFCNTCSVYRPPRASHCGVCNNCIESFDHHCSWIGTCIAKRNYHYFYFFLGTLTSFSLLIFSCAFSLLKIKINQEEDKSFESTEAFIIFLREYPLTMFLGIYAFIFFLFSGILFTYHTYLIFTNQTTNEELKKIWSFKAGNPYKISIYINLAFCCLYRKKKKFFKFDQVAIPIISKYKAGLEILQTNINEKRSDDNEKNSENFEYNDIIERMNKIILS